MQQARVYLNVAELVMSVEESVECTVATGNAVLAAIAASDAMCCALSGQRYRGEDHRAAADLLGEVTGDRKLAAALREAIDLKDAGHYGLDNLSSARARKAVRRAKILVAAAEERVS